MGPCSQKGTQRSLDTPRVTSPHLTSGYLTSPHPIHPAPPHQVKCHARTKKISKEYQSMFSFFLSVTPVNRMDNRIGQKMYYFFLVPARESIFLSVSPSVPKK